MIDHLFCLTDFILFLPYAKQSHNRLRAVSPLLGLASEFLEGRDGKIVKISILVGVIICMGSLFSQGQRGQSWCKLSLYTYATRNMSLLFLNKKEKKRKNDGHYSVTHVNTRFSDPDRSLNRKRERFKVYEVEPGSNRDDVIINLIIN